MPVPAWEEREDGKKETTGNRRRTSVSRFGAFGLRGLGGLFLGGGGLLDGTGSLGDAAGEVLVDHAAQLLGGDVGIGEYLAVYVHEFLVGGLVVVVAGHGLALVGVAVVLFRVFRFVGEGGLYLLGGDFKLVGLQAVLVVELRLFERAVLQVAAGALTAGLLLLVDGLLYMVSAVSMGTTNIVSPLGFSKRCK